MAIALTLGREVMRMIRTYAPQSRRPHTEKLRFFDEMASEWDFESNHRFFGGDFSG